MKNRDGKEIVLLAAGHVGAEPASTAPAGDWDGFYLGIAVTSGDLGGLLQGTDVGVQGFGLQSGYLRDLGRVVVGGELAYVAADFDDASAFSLNSTRLKAISGMDAGRLMPYAFAGLTEMELGLGGASATETGTNYGLGGRVALGANGGVVAGLEYLVEEVNDFKSSGLDFKNRDLSLRLDVQY